MKVRAKEIAAQLGISPATVSLVLNNKPGVSEKTRKLVLNTIKEYGFYPTTAPLNVKNKNGNIRFIVFRKHSVTNEGTPYFSELIEGIDREARNAGYNLGITYISEDKDDVLSVLHVIKNEKPEGILILATEMIDEDLTLFERMKIPLLILDNYFEEESVNLVCIDNMEGAYKAVKYLSELGHKKIGYLHSGIKIHNFEQRMDGVKRAIQKTELLLLPEHIFCVELAAEHAFEPLIRILRSDNAPTALFADNDTMAYGAIRAMKEHGILVPEHVSVIGFDDMPLCEMLEPKLTTIRVFKQRLGMMAMKRLVEVMEENPQETMKSFIGTELIVRDSTRCI